VALTARYLADKSALARFAEPAIAERLRPLLEEGAIATCPIIDLEVLYSARSWRDYEAVRGERAALEMAPVTETTIARALEVQRLLARKGYHRVAIPDLLIAAAAEAAGLVVLHYDADYELICAATNQRHEWMVPRGSI
jgi:hypothetical protein